MRVRFVSVKFEQSQSFTVSQVTKQKSPVVPNCVLPPSLFPVSASGFAQLAPDPSELVLPPSRGGSGPGSACGSGCGSGPGPASGPGSDPCGSGGHVEPT